MNQYYSQKSFLAVTAGAQLPHKLTTSSETKYILVDNKYEVWGYIASINLRTNKDGTLIQKHRWIIWIIAMWLAVIRYSLITHHALQPKIQTKMAFCYTLQNNQSNAPLKLQHFELR